MASPTDHTHHIKIRSTQLEMPTSANTGRPEDYDRKLRDAQEEIERIQQQREELERKKIELEEITNRKRAFVSQQVELTERLTSAITLIERELYEMRNETSDLEQCRACFAGHLDKLQKISPENWTRDNTSEKLEKAMISVDLAADEYDQAAAHFEGSRSGAIFGRASKKARGINRGSSSGEFATHFRNGLAFNLPIVILGTLALIVYLVK